MLKALLDFFENSVKRDMSGGGLDMDHAVKVATAALLIEVVSADDHVHVAEEQVLVSVLVEKFTLSEQEVHDIVALAHREATESNDYFQFTSLINRNFTYEQKVKVIEMLWSVVFADGHLDRFEEYTVRKIADLLYVSHSDFISAKIKAER